MDGLQFEEDWIAAALTVIERFTGVVMTEQIWDPQLERTAPIRMVPRPTQEDYDTSEDTSPIADPAIEDPTTDNQATDVSGQAPVERPRTVRSDLPIGPGTLWATTLYGGPDGLGHPAAWQLPGIRDIRSHTEVGGAHFVVRTDGTLWVWGNNERGRLGLGHNQQVHSPIEVLGLGRVSGVSVGAETTYAVTDDGVVWAWGRPWRGTLADGVTRKSMTPVPIPGLRDISSLYGNDDTRFAVTSSGEVWGWGDGTSGRLGDGAEHKYPINEPVRVAGIPPVAELSLSRETVTAVTRDGSVLVWGGTYWAQVDPGSSTQAVRTPTPIDDLAQAVTVSNGCALRSDGTVWIWRQVPGERLELDAEDHEGGSYYSSSTLVAGLAEDEIAQLSPEMRRQYLDLLASLTTNDPEPWTLDASGEKEPVIWSQDFDFVRRPRRQSKPKTATEDAYFPRPDGNDGNQEGFTPRFQAQQVPGLTGVTAISSGAERTYALRSDGTVWTWGPGEWRGPETEPSAAEPFPVHIPGLDGIVTLAEDGRPYAIGSAGTVWTWVGNPGAADGPRRLIAHVPEFTGAVAVTDDGPTLYVVKG